jgi:4-amino-4-deoxy-L-arabinose transferase-like glycosyltransferase
LALLSPLLGGTALIVTPDLPLLFCNALALWVFYRWREKPVWWLGLAFGVAMGLGFSSKYVMVLFPLCVFPLIFASQEMRPRFVKQLHWIVLGGLLGTLPVWLWNLNNDFISFRFQAQHGLGRKVWKPSWTIEYVLAQIGLIFPIILYWALRARRKLPAIFHFLAWLPLLFFFITTSHGYAEANWPIVAYPAVIALAVASLPRNLRGLQATIALWWAFMALLFAIVILQPDWARTSKSKEFHGFDALIAASRPLEPLYARSYQMAAKMHFELRRPVFKLKGMNRVDFYDYLDESEPHASTYYMAAEKTDALPLYYTSRGHQIVERRPVDGEYEIWKVEVRP